MNQIMFSGMIILVILLEDHFTLWLVLAVYK